MTTILSVKLLDVLFNRRKAKKKGGGVKHHANAVASRYSARYGNRLFSTTW